MTEHIDLNPLLRVNTMISESDLNSIIFMKVGRHAGEDFEEKIGRAVQ